MRLSEVRINLCNGNSGRLKAFCSLTFDDALVIRDVKLIEGNDGLFLAMPSRKLCDRCQRCGEKNHLRAGYCNHCGTRLDENRHLNYRGGNGADRFKLHADIAHPINSETRLEVERRALRAYRDELERSKQPGYVPPRLMDADLPDVYDMEPHSAASAARLRPTGTTLH